MVSHEKTTGMKIFTILALVMSLSVFLAACTTTEPVNTREDVPEKAMEQEDIMVKDDQPMETESNDAAMQAIADGTYTDEVSYNYHEGTERMEVSITVENDVVTDASITPLGEPHSVSLKFMNGVNDALPELVIGKKIDEIDIPTQVSGSSLTTAAFKEQLNMLVDTY